MAPPSRAGRRGPLRRRAAEPPPDPRRDARIVRDLVRWFEAVARPMPWRTQPRDPYIVLVSEFMLQQTQVSRVLERFGPFIQRFPDLRALAAAHEQDVLAAWSGLGYYRRARNLQAAARAIVDRFGGRVPAEAAALASLPGVGRYTAGAIASIAFGQPAPAVDGNVTRVVLRLEGRDLPQDGAAARDLVWARAGSLVARAAARRPTPPQAAGALNEALMELGATVCTPRRPRCEACPVRRDCRAHQSGAQDLIPRPKTAAAPRRLHCASVIVENAAGRLLVERRPDTGLWAGMWQAPTLEARAPIKAAALAAWLGLGPLTRLGSFRHGTSHRDAWFTVWRAARLRGRAPAALAANGQGRAWKTPAQIAALPLSNAQRRVLAMAAAAGG